MPKSNRGLDMTRKNFTGKFLGYMIKKIPMWLAEEDTEGGHLDNMQKYIKRHNDEIQEVLKENEI